MNRRMVLFTVGRILTVEAGLMALPVIVGLIYRESVTGFLISMVVLFAAGVLMCLKKPRVTTLYAREGFFIVAASWALMSLGGALPFILSGCFNSVWDCIFEIVSGFTTTGASILADVEALPHCLLFWRSFSHWIGGMGVLVLVLAIVPMAGEGSLYLMRAEVPGPVVGKLVPKMRTTAIILYAVYGAMTVVLIGLLLAGGMPFFDSVCTAFGTAGTGGFSVRNAGIAYYNSAYIEIVLGIFMLLFGINFNLFYLILVGKAREALRSEELRAYLIVIAVATAAITVNTLPLSQSFGDTLRTAFFQVSSVITTTGFATVDFAGLWPQFAQNLLLILMMVGACTGSTGGGLKISRVLLLIKSFGRETRRQIHPRLVATVHLDSKPVAKETLRGVRVYLVAYVMIVVVSSLLLSLDNHSFTTNFSAEMACFNNIGPGLGDVGPYGNYDFYSPFSKMLLSFNMLLGRLEIIPLLVLFSPSSWRKSM